MRTMIRRFILVPAGLLAMTATAAAKPPKSTTLDKAAVQRHVDEDADNEARLRKTLDRLAERPMVGRTVRNKGVVKPVQIEVDKRRIRYRCTIDGLLDGQVLYTPLLQRSERETIEAYRARLKRAQKKATMAKDLTVLMRRRIGTEATLELSFDRKGFGYVTDVMDLGRQ